MIYTRLLLVEHKLLGRLTNRWTVLSIRTQIPFYLVPEPRCNPKIIENSLILVSI